MYSENTTIDRLVGRLRMLDDGRMADVIEARFGLLDGQEHTLEEIGTTLSLTRERIRQIEARALQYMTRFAAEMGKPGAMAALQQMRVTARENAKKSKHTRVSLPSVSFPGPAPTIQQLTSMREQVNLGMAHLQSLGITVNV